MPQAHERAAGSNTDDHDGGAVTDVRSPWVYAVADAGSPWWGGADVAWFGADDGVAVASPSRSVTWKFRGHPTGPCRGTDGVRSAASNSTGA